MPAVGWDGRDVSGLSHEQIHRWTRDGASPEALAAARDRHLARADELRGAAERLQAAQRGVGETWVGRDADAAGARSRVLAQRMEQLAETVGGQARGVDGLRAALVRVRAAVGPPRPPALPSLGVTPVLDELRSLVTGRPADGYGGFRAAAADQAAAREAYRTYLSETAAAARGVGPAGAGPAPAPGTAPVPTASGRAPLPVGARGAASGVLQRAAAPAGPTTGSGAVPTTGAGVRPPAAAGAGAAASPVTPVAGPSATAAAPGSTGLGGGPRPSGGTTAGGVPGGVAGGAARGVAGGGAGRGAGGVAPVPGAAAPGRRGPGAATARPPGPGPGAPRPVAPTRPPDERAPSAVGRPPRPPQVLADHRPAARPDDFGPDGPIPQARPEDGEEPTEEGREAVPVRHESWLVDPDPAGWGAGGRRVAPPVLGEGP
ncbi:hypothetical protein [Actinomycetospora sp. CA-084318]|uniref:WXG100 family type VII secretion target n=1 Tax=Actinomycetospora sp. CA-084318 TaxID=3239892 RepID=UPI003D9677AE